MAALVCSRSKRPSVVVLVDVDRLEQSLVAQPTVRVVGFGVAVGYVGHERRAAGVSAHVGPSDQVADRKPMTQRTRPDHPETDL